MILGYILAATLMSLLVVALLPQLWRIIRQRRSRTMDLRECQKWLHDKDYISRPLRPSRAKKKLNNE